MAGLEQTYSELNRSHSKEKEFVLKRLIQCCIYDTAIEFGDEHIDTRLQWDKLKSIHKAGLLTENRVEDPLFLKKYFEKQPDEFLGLLNLSEKVVGNQKVYDEYCLWFAEKLAG